MADYIDREKIFSIWRSMPAPASVTSLAAAISQTPAADVAEVRHGRWKNGICTDCGFDIRCLTDGENDLEEWVWEGLDYCPNCGALMKEDEHETR